MKIDHLKTLADAMNALLLKEIDVRDAKLDVWHAVKRKLPDGEIKSMNEDVLKCCEESICLARAAGAETIKLLAVWARDGRNLHPLTRLQFELTHGFRNLDAAWDEVRIEARTPVKAGQLTKAEAAKLIGVKPPQITKLVQRGKLELTIEGVREYAKKKSTRDTLDFYRG